MNMTELPAKPDHCPLSDLLHPDAQAPQKRPRMAEVSTEGILLTPVQIGGMVTHETDHELTLTPEPPVVQKREDILPVLPYDNLPAVANSGASTSSVERWWRYAVAGLDPSRATQTTRLLCMMRGRQPCYAVVMPSGMCRTKQGVLKNWYTCTAEELWATAEGACLAYEQAYHIGEKPRSINGQIAGSSELGKTVRALLLDAYKNSTMIRDAMKAHSFFSNYCIRVEVPTMQQATATAAPATLTRLVLGTLKQGLRLEIGEGLNGLILTFTPETNPTTLFEAIHDAIGDVPDPLEGMYCFHDDWGEVKVLEALKDGWMVVEIMDGREAGQVLSCREDDLHTLYDEEDR